MPLRPPVLRLAPTTRPRPEEETVAESLDRIEDILRTLVGDIVVLRRRVADGQP